jgi:hypothetical protein
MTLGYHADVFELGYTESLAEATNDSLALLLRNHGASVSRPLTLSRERAEIQSGFQWFRFVILEVGKGRAVSFGSPQVGRQPEYCQVEPTFPHLIQRSYPFHSTPPRKSDSFCRWIEVFQKDVAKDVPFPLNFRCF